MAVGGGGGDSLEGGSLELTVAEFLADMAAAGGERADDRRDSLAALLPDVKRFRAASARTSASLESVGTERESPEVDSLGDVRD